MTRCRCTTTRILRNEAESDKVLNGFVPSIGLTSNPWDAVPEQWWFLDFGVQTPGTEENLLDLYIRTNGLI